MTKKKGWLERERDRHNVELNAWRGKARDAAAEVEGLRRDLLIFQKAESSNGDLLAKCTQREKNLQMFLQSEVALNPAMARRLNSSGVCCVSMQLDFKGTFETYTSTP